MKKLIFGIFAHPDDEAFGPAGTLLGEVAAGSEVQLVSLTLGEAGQNPDDVEDLMAVRRTEWEESGARIGASKLHYLGYKDSQLCNQSMIRIGDQLVELMERELRQSDCDECEIISIELGGVTGHIDHIVAGRAACWAFYTLRPKEPRLRRIRLTCLPYQYAPAPNVDWLFMERGCKPDEVDEIIDARHLREQIIHVMRAHRTQRSDLEFHLRTMGDDLGVNYFRVLE